MYPPARSLISKEKLNAGKMKPDSGATSHVTKHLDLVEGSGIEVIVRECRQVVADHASESPANSGSRGKPAK
jgi:hypothetical protein